MDFGRIGKVLSTAMQLGADAAVISAGANLKYLFGLDIDPHERAFMAVLGEGRRPAFVLPLLEKEKVETGTAGLDPQIFGYTDQEGPFGAVCAAFENLAIDGARMVIGAEFLHMRLMERQLIRSAVGEFDVLDMDGIIMGERIIKDDSERACLRRAAKIVDIGIEEARRAIKPGISENKVAEEIERAMMAAGADCVPFKIVLSGPNASLPHGRTSNRLIEEGELVICDIGASFGGYFGDITRTIPAGRPSGLILRAYDAVYRANEAGRKKAGPGISAESLDAACRRIIEEAGFGPQFIHRTGHGLGLEVHEEPYIVAGNARILEPGMAFTIEPGVYLPGVGGVRIEDDVIINEYGSEVLTVQPRELEIR